MLTLLIVASGLFTIGLGLVHFIMPVLFDFRGAIPREGPALEPFRLLFYVYDTKRSDVYGLAWVMNHAVSYTLVTIGVIDLFVSSWLAYRWGWLIASWIALWWLIRAGSQLYLGRRRGDWLIVAWFCVLAVLHVVAAAVSRS
jgi:hypothetical protein